ncbi:class I SAM-dependent methyltransferase [Candidatus Dojkabacteria bacterium]|nr:class I SAM-dependent methyltransferase [Candidatus Dojkabacteria bacterium]
MDLTETAKWFLYLANILIIIGSFYFSIKVIFLVWTWTPFYRGNAPYVPTRKWAVKAAFEMLDPKKGDRVIDLGCGDGRFVLYTVSHSDAEVTGVEISYLLMAIAKLRSFLTRKKGNLELILDDHKSINLSPYNKIFIFGITGLIDRLKPKFKKELKKGTRIVSVMFPIEVDWLKEIKTEKRGNYSLYLYERI